MAVYKTEKETLSDIERKLHILDHSLNEQQYTISEISELLPAWLHFNAPHDLHLDYCSRPMEEHFDKSVDEIRDGGAEFLSNLVHPDSTKVVVPQLLGQLQQKDPFQSLTVFQLMRSKPDAEFEWFYTVSKKHAETGGLISLTNPIRSLGFLAEKLECVIEEHVFMKENYRRFMTLTRREREILGLIAQGETHKRIADRLYISPFTVKSHRQNIIRKLETRRIADFIKYAEMFDLD